MLLSDAARLSRRQLLSLAAAAAATLAFPPMRQSALAATRGALLSSTPLFAWESAETKSALQDGGMALTPVLNGVAAFRLIYATIDVSGAPTTASALLVLPHSEASTLPTVLWMHGTTVYRGDAASVSAESSDRLVAVAFAAAGYAVVAPDYLGLGLGPGYHPFRDPASEVSAAIDALRAAGEVVHDAGRALQARLLISGFSQGGPAAMALGQAVQEGAAPGYALGAVAPIGGPFDTSGTLHLALSGGIEMATAYLAYLVVAWNRVHHFYATPEDAFLPPYDATVETLLDGEHTGEEILAGLPATPDALFTPAFMQLLRQPSGALREALRAVDSTCDWRPQAAVEIYAARGDRDVPIANARFCQAQLRAQGVDVPLHDAGDVDHFGTVIVSLPQVIAFFDSISTIA